MSRYLHAADLWECLKRECCADPVEALRCVMVTEAQFTAAYEAWTDAAQQKADADWDDFMKVFENPPPPTPALREAYARYQAMLKDTTATASHPHKPGPGEPL